MDKKPEFDFSVFHPLDHLPGSQTCFRWHGGPWNHLHLWWDYQAIPWLWAQTLCRIGWHREVAFWNTSIILMDPNQEPDGYVCACCERDL